MGEFRRTRWGRRPRATECERDPGAMEGKPGMCLCGLLRVPRSGCWNHREPSSVMLAAVAVTSDASADGRCGEEGGVGGSRLGRAGNHDARQQSL